MNQLPSDPYIRDDSGTVLGHYSSEPLAGGRGGLRLGSFFITTWMGRDFKGKVVGFEGHGTNPYHRVIVRYWH